MRRLRARVERFTLQHPSGVNLAIAVFSAAGAAVLFWLIARRVDTYLEVAAAGLGAAAGMTVAGLSSRFAMVKEWRLSKLEQRLWHASLLLGGLAAAALFYGLGGDVGWAAGAGFMLAYLLGLIAATLRARELWRTDPDKARELGERSKEFLP